MEWWVLLNLLVISLIAAMFTGMPVAFAFLIINLSVSLLVIGEQGPLMLILDMMESVINFSLTPVPLFVLMGAILFHSGVVTQTIDRIAEWMGAIPGRLALIAVAAGALLGVLSGSTMASTALLNSLLFPEMVRKGYDTRLSIGSIMASGGLAMILPPSSLAIIYATVAKISVGDFLIAGIIPGIVMAMVYTITIMVRTTLKPSLAPRYEIEQAALSQRLIALCRDAVPVAVLLFVVLGLMLLGVATPTECAALGAVGAALIAIAYRKMSLRVFRLSLIETVKVSGMMMLIIAGSAVYSQLLAFSGTSRNLVKFVLELDLSPTLIVLSMLFLVFILGFFMEQMAIIMITVPLYTMVVSALGIDQLWFGILMLICLQIGLTTPPFGLILFVVKGMYKQLSTRDIYWSAAPFVLCDLCSMILIWFVPYLATWLPNVFN